MMWFKSIFTMEQETLTIANALAELGITGYLYKFYKTKI